MPGAPVEPVLRIRDIQGIVLPGLSTQHQRLLGLRFDGADAGLALRAWLRATAHRVTSLALAVELRNTRRAAPRSGARRPPAGTMLGMALSEAALRLLTPDVDEMHDEAFKTAIAERLHVLQSAVEKHVNTIFDKLDLFDTAGYSRRVLAILRYLGT